MNRFSWRGAPDPDVYIDYYHKRTLTVVRARLNHARLARELAAQGDTARAVQVIDRCLELFPVSKLGYDFYFGDIISACFTAGQKEKAKELVAAIFRNVPVLDSGARGSTTTFVERGLGDVLVTWENEGILAVNELGKDKFDIVYPSLSILAEPPVAVVDKVVEKRGTRLTAQAYLDYLYSEEGQQIAARHYYRPTHPTVAGQYARQFPKLKLVTIDDTFGGWQKAQKTHFADGGTFDQIYLKK